jgi:hypothetical protein
MIVVGLALLTLGFVGGRAWAMRQVAALPPAPAPVQSDQLATPILDVPGDDVPGLPRFGDARRVEYRQTIDGELIETEVEYVVADQLEVVHDFYRTVFEEQGWTVADLGVYQGEWTFFVIQDDREALLELESRGPLIEVEIEIIEPIGEGLTGAP